MKKYILKTICIIIIVLILIFMVGLTIYKYSIKEDNSKSMLNVINVSDFKRQVINGVSDSEKYKDDIIWNDTTNYNFKLQKESSNADINAFIDKDGYFYLKNIDTNNQFRVTNIKMETLFVEQEDKALYIYLISQDSKMYVVTLYDDIDINNVNFYEASIVVKPTNFTKLKLMGDRNNSTISIIVLASDGNLYDAVSGIRYEESMYLLDDMYYIYDDLSITDIYGNLLEDEIGNNLKFKYYIKMLNPNKNFANTDSLIITEDNKIIYIIQYSKNLYIYYSKVKKLEYEKGNNNIVTLKIELDNGYIYNIESIYESYYGFK